jgi:hypothetical protein
LGGPPAAVELEDAEIKQLNGTKHDASECNGNYSWTN